MNKNTRVRTEVIRGYGCSYLTGYEGDHERYRLVVTDQVTIHQGWEEDTVNLLAQDDSGMGPLLMLSIESAEELAVILYQHVKRSRAERARREQKTLQLDGTGPS